MGKKLKSVELFLALGLATTINVAATQAEKIDREDNLVTERKHIFDKK